jgi:hypothetical protein
MEIEVEEKEEAVGGFTKQVQKHQSYKICLLKYQTHIET